MLAPLALPLLLVDAGNSDLKLAVVSSDESVPFSVRAEHRQVQWLQDFRQSELENWLAAVVSKSGTQVQAVVSSSVVAPEAFAWVETSIQKILLQSNWLRVETANSERFGVSLGAYPPHQLGADRFANILGLRREWPILPVNSTEHAVIISAGTATTFELVRRETSGSETVALQYQGGLLLPGASAYLHSLSYKTRLPCLPLPVVNQEAQQLGQNTQDCLLAGFQLGYPASVAGTLEALLLQYPQAWICLTGGFAEPLLPALQAVCHQHQKALHHKPQLLWRGLQQYYQI